MAKICWYFQLHQPWRLRPLTLFDVGKTGMVQNDYFSIPGEYDFANDRVLRKVAEKSYRPMLLLLLHLLNTHPNFHFTLSLSGVFIEQLQEYAPDIVVLLQKMIATRRVEILGETYYHSLASIFDPEEFVEQVQQHSNTINKIFNVKPTVFRNTELIYSNDIASQVAALGFQGMLTEGVDRVLAGRAPTKVYYSVGSEKLPLLLKHYQLSDDVAFRFSEKNWSAWPLLAETYTYWLTDPFMDEEIINLFMDFETFGEHQWESTGIFSFFEQVVAWLESNQQAEFVTPSQVFAQVSADVSEREFVPDLIYSTQEPISWADVDRDLTAWLGNDFQNDTTQKIYKIKNAVLSTKDESLIQDWRRLQTSDHFYYMCTKWFADGDVHAYFSPYGSPYNAYVNYSFALADVLHRLRSYQESLET